MKVLDIDLMLHGGDYNPDQWLQNPEILEQDIKLLKEAHINFVSLGIFSWTQLEREEGVYTFDWLDEIVDKLHNNGFKIVLATPSGGKPSWISTKYPETCRVDKEGRREYHGNRHNHCMSSPVYREKVKLINKEITKRYGSHPAVILWHISNEFSGYCYCDKCIAKFRKFLEEKYKTMDNLNNEWWHAFWSHKFNSFEEITPPTPYGEQSNIALEMDWDRFTTWNTIDFYKHEVDSVREFSEIPATTNFWGGTWLHLDYFEFAKEVDVVSYDSYPEWHSGDDYKVALKTSLLYDLMRSLKGNKPFLLMESTPSAANWRNAAKLKRPKMHELSSIQAIAHGSDMVGYFQMRKGRGQSEKFHSAVIDHDSTSENRVYRDVKQVGESLKDLSEILGAVPENEIAIYMDWSNNKAISANKGPRMAGMNILGEIENYYTAVLSLGYGLDFINFESNLDKYTVIILPMVYSAPDSFWKKVLDFTKKGGKVISTYMSGYANHNDLIHISGINEDFKKITGLKYHELDALEDRDRNFTTIFGKTFKVRDLCELNKNVSATIVSVYEEDFYKGLHLITENNGNYHIAARIEFEGIKHFMKNVFEQMKIGKVIELNNLPFIVSKRKNGNGNFIFLMNFTEEQHKLRLDGNYVNLSNEKVDEVELGKYEYIVLKEKK